MRKILLFLCAIGMVFVFSACDLLLPKIVIPSMQPTQSTTVTQKATQPPKNSVAVTTQATKNVSNVSMTLNFAFGQYTGVYTGEVLNGVPHGQGAFSADATEDEASWVYDGSWVNGHQSGEGSTVWSDNFQEEGTYQDDYLNGQGKSYCNGLLRYEGGYSDGEYDGYGTLYDLLGNVMYVGNFTGGYLKETAETHAARMNPFIAECQPLSYTNSVNNPSAYRGQKVSYTGSIYYIYTYDNSDYYFDFYLTDSTGNESILVLYRLYAGESTFAEGDTVTVYGILEGTDTYQASDGTYIPYVQVEAWGIK